MGRRHGFKLTNAKQFSAFTNITRSNNELLQVLIEVPAEQRPSGCTPWTMKSSKVMFGWCFPRGEQPQQNPAAAQFFPFDYIKILLWGWWMLGEWVFVPPKWSILHPALAPLVPFCLFFFIKYLMNFDEFRGNRIRWQFSAELLFEKLMSMHEAT